MIACFYLINNTQFFLNAAAKTNNYLSLITGIHFPCKEIVIHDLACLLHPKPLNYKIIFI